MACFYCQAGFPLRPDGFHYGSQSKGMIPDARCQDPSTKGGGVPPSAP